MLSSAEGSHSGLVRPLGERIYRKVSWVRIPHLPQWTAQKRVLFVGHSPHAGICIPCSRCTCPVDVRVPGKSHTPPALCGRERSIMVSQKNKSVTLYCFTPLATLITFFIEILLAIYVLFKYKMSPFVRISTLILVLLGLFQFSEYAICKIGFQELFTKIGYGLITPLPALVLHLVGIATKKNIWIAIGIIGYILASLFLFVIFFVPNILVSTICSGKFLIFTVPSTFYTIYRYYYFGLLALGLFILVLHILKKSPKSKLYIWMILGYGSFIVPTFALYIIKKFNPFGFPSVMCGFAVLFAITLAFKILPLQKIIEKK